MTSQPTWSGRMADYGSGSGPQARNFTPHGVLGEYDGKIAELQAELLDKVRADLGLAG